MHEPRTARPPTYLDSLWFLACASLSSLWCLGAGARLGPTFDEPIYVQQGLKFWHTGSHYELLRVGTTPLAMDLDALPIFLWEQVRGVPFDPSADLAQILPVARAGTLVFWWVLLFYAWRIAASLAGRWAGRLAVTFLASEPNFLAHASLVTADIAVSACLLASLYYFRKGREACWRYRVGLPALWLGIALAAKLTAIVFAPLGMAVIELERVWSHDGAQAFRARVRNAVAKLYEQRRDFVHVGFLGVSLLFAYCGCDWQEEPSFVAWANSLPDGPVHETMSWIAEHLCIFNNAGCAIVRQVRHNVCGHGVYLLGDTWQRAIWYYFPVALSIKLALPVLLLPCVLLLLRPGSLLNWPCLAALALLVFSLTCRVQIGIRFMLPLVALAIVGVGAAATQTYSSYGSGAIRRGLLTIFLVGGLCWMSITAASVWPNGLCHVNELWGGTEDGYLCVSDSNYDWGQGLPELAAWQRDNNLPELDVWYFGTDPGLSDLAMRRVYLERLGPNELGPALAGHRLAVSATYLYGRSLDSPGYWRAVDYLRQQRPIARTSTFSVFDFEDAR